LKVEKISHYIFMLKPESLSMLTLTQSGMIPALDTRAELLQSGNSCRSNALAYYKSEFIYTDFYRIESLL
jgi:hypothetical protein